MPYAINGPKWGSPGYGLGATVTWSFADLDVDQTLAQTYAGYPDFTSTIPGGFRDLARAAFAAWDRISGIDFVEVADATTSDIRLGQKMIDGAASPGANSVTGLARFWFGGSGSLLAASIEFDVDAFDSAQRFYNTALHEIGHAIGLDHSNSPADVMFPSLSSQNAAGLSIGDMSGARYLYTGGIAVEGTEGPDSLATGAGPDLVAGYGGNDTLSAGDGADLVFSGAGNDLVYGNQGDDLIYGNQGGDTVFGGRGNDTVIAGQGADQIYGNLENDVIYGNLDNDTLLGGQGDDLLYGGQGDDLLFGNIGRDTLVGSLGADRFVFGQNGGADLVLGFNLAEGDKLDFGGQSYVQDADGQGGTLFTLAGGGTVDLAGVSARSITSAFFV